MLVIFDQNGIFNLVCKFFQSSSDQIRIKVASIFHSAVLYDDSDEEIIFDSFENQILKQSDNILEVDANYKEEEDFDNLPIAIFNKILNLFFQQSYIWSADVKNEELQFICLDFELIIIHFVYKYKNIFEPFHVEVIRSLTELYLDIFQVGSEKLKALSIKCLLCLMIGHKIIVFNTADVVSTTLQNIDLQERYSDRFIFHFLSALLTLILSGQNDISFLHEYVDFEFLCEKLLESTDKSTIYYLCLFLHRFIRNGPDSIDLILKANFMECYSQKLVEGNVYYSQLISGSIKDIFELGTSEQSLFVFQSGIIPPLLQFFEDSFDMTMPAVFQAICNAIQRCTEELGDEAFHEIQTMFFNESMDVLSSLRNSQYTQISEYADRLIDLLELG